jgi:pimeloyl-ACP methyl ester carboxylesterase
MAVSAALGDVHEVELAQGTVRYRERGSGPPIVFVHGVAVNADLWRKVVPLLADRFRCIAPDWPVGAHEVPVPRADVSPPGLAALIADFLEKLELEDVTLVGNDTGGAVCQIVVTTRPERIGRLVLTSCDAFERFPPPPFGFLRVLGIVPGALALSAQSLRLRAAQKSPLGYGWLSNELPEREVMEGWTAPARRAEIRADGRRFLRSVSNRQTLEAAEKLPSFEKPVLLAWAAEDKLFPLSLAERLAERFPNCRLEVIEGSRTFVSEDRPERLAELIGEFAGAERP